MAQLRPRVLEDGSLLYPVRGKPPEVPEGYFRDKGNPFRIRPEVRDCIHRGTRQKHNMGSCDCKTITINTCKLYGDISMRRCVGCKDHKEPTLLQKAANVIEAVIKNDKVDQDSQNQRADICRECSYRRKKYCGVCGCKLERLIPYKETKKWGCKHPNRKDGKGWPMNI